MELTHYEAAGRYLDGVMSGRTGIPLKAWKAEQEKLGEKLGVTNKTISRWESGNYITDVEMLSLLSIEFGVSINELISNERLLAGDFKKAADNNLVKALNNSTFTLREKIAFFKQKWLHELSKPLFYVLERESVWQYCS